MEHQHCPICKMTVTGQVSKKSDMATQGTVICENEDYIHVVYRNRHFLVRTSRNIFAEFMDSGLFHMFC